MKWTYSIQVITIVSDALCLVTSSVEATIAIYISASISASEGLTVIFIFKLLYTRGKANIRSCYP